MRLVRYELRLYDNQGRLLAYVPFETEQDAIDYFVTDEDMGNDWALYIVTYSPNHDTARFLRRMKRND